MKCILGVLALFFVFLISLGVSALTGKYSLDVTDAMLLHYSGFEGEGRAELELDTDKVILKLDEAYEKYGKKLWPLIKKHTREDFEALAPSVKEALDKNKELKNGDVINISVSYDESLAKKLGVKLKYSEIPITVEGLDKGIVLSEEEFFKDISLSINGISPVIGVEVVNNSNDNFLKSVDYEISDAKDYYENGDEITVVANYDRENAISLHYDVKDDKPQKSYTINTGKKYIENTSQFTDEALREAIEYGKTCFTDANEYGLRIFTEAGLTYTWVGTQDYTFEWSNPRIISAYIETIKDEYRGDFSKMYNYLELAYEIHIEQANGTGCDAEAIVCFDSMTIDENGKIDINKESAQLFSASYLDKNIKNSLKGWFGDSYNIDKFDLSGLSE